MIISKFFFRRFFWGAVAVSVILTGSLSAQTGRQLIDKIAAVVDDEAIMMSEVQQYAYFEAMNLHINPSNTEEFDKIMRRVLETMIQQKIMLAQARFDSITIDEAQVEQSLEQQIRERVQQAGGEDELERAMGKSVKELKRLYRPNIRKQMLAQRIQSTKFNDVKVSRSEIEKFFEEFQDSLPQIGASVKFSQILLEVKAGDEAFAEARRMAQMYLDSIKKGADFATIAKAVSTDPGSGKKGGDLGWFNRNDFVKEFADAAVRLEPGEISDVVKSEFGYHIIQMIEKSGERIHVRHILLGVANGPEDKTRTREKLGRIRQDILEGKISFEKAALQYSDDPAKKGNLGNMGWIEIATLQDKSFVKALDPLKSEEISEPFETPFGFFIVQLHDRRDTRKLNLNEDWQTIENFALRQKQAKEMDKWLEKIKSKFFIDVRL
ncbi:peptidylprolyl isomerase [bacterium]|nr:peptidylprolyl isomerase [bacterium]